MYNKNANFQNTTKLTETEQDLLSHMQHGYQLETDSLGGNPGLRRLKNNLSFRASRLTVVQELVGSRVALVCRYGNR